MFDEFIKSGKVRKGAPDLALAKSLVTMSDAQFAFAASMEVTEQNTSPLLVNYYESLREICEAICSKNGFKVYSHEAFTYYLKEYLHEERISLKFDRLRKLRNGINYYGKGVNVIETKAAAADVKLLIQELKRKYISELIK